MALNAQKLRTTQIEKGKTVCEEGTKVDAIYVVVKGRINAIGKYGNVKMDAGSVIGIMDLEEGEYLYSYLTETNCELASFACNTVEEIEFILHMNPELASVFVNDTANQMVNIYNRIQEMSSHGEELYEGIHENFILFENLGENVLKPEEEKIFEQIEPISICPYDEKKVEYYEQLLEMERNVEEKFFENSIYFTIHHLNELKEIAFYGLKCQKTIQSQYRLLDNSYKISKKLVEKFLGYAPEHGKGKAQTENHAQGVFATEDIFELTHNTYSKLVSFAGYPEESAKMLGDLIMYFRKLNDKQEVNDQVSRIRKQIAKLFYELYECVYFKYEEKKERNRLVETFLDYGFIDENLLSEQQIIQLFAIDPEEKSESYEIYRMREWLHEIYMGKMEPSKNEFDTDYTTLVRERAKKEQLTPQQIKEISTDQKEKVRFEIRNMFQTVSRMTFGRVLTFCPILYTNDESENLENTHLTKLELEEAINEYKKIDYSLFYRKYLYADEKKGIEKEYIQLEVRPKILLMPINGTKAAMWQELSGVRKDTAARFMFPSFTREDTKKLLVHVLGQYRWELCKTMEGIYWNDMTEKSLTAEYCDYLQFYRKNRDLSAEVKEHIKTALSSVNNNYREMFAKEYAIWLNHEANGIAKLNKNSRRIIFTYVPFAKETRAKLSQHPMYAELVRRHEGLSKQTAAKIDKHYKVLSSEGIEIAEEMKKNIQFYEL